MQGFLNLPIYFVTGQLGGSRVGEFFNRSNDKTVSVANVSIINGNIADLCKFGVSESTGLFRSATSFDKYIRSSRQGIVELLWQSISGIPKWQLPSGEFGYPISKLSPQGCYLFCSTASAQHLTWIADLPVGQAKFV